MKIRKANKTDNKHLAQLHISVFPGFFLSTLGEKFLNTYYKVVLRHPETICLFAEDNNANICGYVLGRINAKGYLRRIVKSAPLVFIWEAIKLLFTRPRALFRLINNLDKRREDSEVTDAQDYAEIGLIGVLPQYKGQGIGHRLFNEFVEILNKNGVERISLTTDADDNVNTLTAYKAWGFEIYYKFVSYPNRNMYRLIKTVKK